MVPNTEDKDEVATGLNIMFYSVAGLCTVLFIAIVLCEFIKSMRGKQAKVDYISGYCVNEENVFVTHYSIGKMNGGIRYYVTRVFLTLPVVMDTEICTFKISLHKLIRFE